MNLADSIPKRFMDKAELLVFVMDELVSGNVLVVENTEKGFLFNGSHRFPLSADIWDEVLGWDFVTPIVKTFDNSLWIFKHERYLKYDIVH